MTRRLTTALCVGALALAAASCSSDKTTSSPATNTSAPSVATTTTTGSAPAKGDKYVALGSSIASGFGISVQSTDCGRSNRSYPHLVAKRYGVTLTDVTCGAATIANVLDSPQGPHPPQIQAVTADTELITVSVGGNDIGYNATALGCGDPTAACSPPPTLSANLTKARAALPDMLEKLHAAAPEATIVFVTYPREVPPGNCPALSYTDADAAVVRSMGEQLETMFVDVVKPTDVVFVDPYVAPGDHTGCAPVNERWTAGKVPDDGFAYHPTALGHEVMAKMIADALGN